MMMEGVISFQPIFLPAFIMMLTTLGRAGFLENNQKAINLYVIVYALRWLADCGTMMFIGFHGINDYFISSLPVFVVSVAQAGNRLLYKTIWPCPYDPRYQLYCSDVATTDGSPIDWFPYFCAMLVPHLLVLLLIVGDVYVFRRRQ